MIIIVTCGFMMLRDWSLITGRRATKWGKSWVRNLLHPPPPLNPQDRLKLVVPPAPPPHFKGWKLFAPPPLSPWLQLQARMLKLPQNFHARPPPPPLISIAKTFSDPPFCRVKTNLPPPPLPFCSPQPAPQLVTSP